MRLVMTVRQEWRQEIVRDQFDMSHIELQLQSRDEDGGDHVLIRVRAYYDQWIAWSPDARHGLEGWTGPFRTALQAAKSQRHWYMPWRKFMQEVRAERDLEDRRV